MGHIVLVASGKGETPRTAVLDANLLLLALCMRVGLDRFRSFKRLTLFNRQDVQVLQNLLQSFQTVVTTAYVLAEVSNLANQLSGALRDEWFRTLAEFALLTEEAHVPTSVISALPEFVRFGVTDAALSALTEDHYRITLDHRLAGYLIAKQKNVINFNDLRFLPLP